jgi:hypothetical protein
MAASASGITFTPFYIFEKKAMSGSIRPDDKSPTNWSRIPRDPAAIFYLNG